MVSVMEYYYGKQHKDKFQALFGQYYIGRNPTPKANSYIVLSLDFSGVQADTLEKAQSDFNTRFKEKTRLSLLPYKSQLPADWLDGFWDAPSVNLALTRILNLLAEYCPGEKVMVLIDEYDHFANPIIARSVEDFQKMAGDSGFVHAFYEVLKDGTGDGIVDRIFITGVSPITLDSLSSGFNIGTDLTRDLEMHDMMGFTPDEVAALLPLASIPDDHHATVMDDLRQWYDGYRFNREAPHHLYNPDMVLYFLGHYARYGGYPENLLDTNIASDYQRLGRMFGVVDRKVNMGVLEKVVEDGQVLTALTEKYSFAREWTADDFASLLFYMGLLTIQGAEFTRVSLGMPNLVIKGLYYEFLEKTLLASASLSAGALRVADHVGTLARDSDIRPLMGVLSTVLERLDNRDALHFNEISAKAVFMALVMPTGVYGVHSEHPIGQGYADLFLRRRPPITGVQRQHLLEMKHIKKGDASEGAVRRKAEEGRIQLQTHLSHPDIQQMGDVMGWLIVAVGYEVRVLEEVRVEKI